MKKTAAVLTVFSLFCILPQLMYAQNWYLSTDLGGERIVALSAADAANIWAVIGSTSGEGKIYYYDGISWSLQTTLFPGGSSELTAIDALDATHVWAGGEDGANPLIYFYDGAAWSFQTELIEVWLDGIYAAGTTSVWATGGGIFVSWDGGATWSKETTAGFHQFGIDGVDSGEIWTVGGPYGAQNQIFYRKGIWEVQTEVANWGEQTVKLRDVCVIDAADVWAAGLDGFLLHYDAFAWTVQTRITGQNFYSLAGRDSNNVWAGSGTGRIYHYDGTTWNLATNLGGSAIYGLAVSADDLWAGDDTGQIFRFGAATPTPVGYHTPPPTPLPTSTPPPDRYPAAAPDSHTYYHSAPDPGLRLCRRYPDILLGGDHHRGLRPELRSILLLYLLHDRNRQHHH